MAKESAMSDSAGTLGWNSDWERNQAEHDREREDIVDLAPSPRLRDLELYSMWRQISLRSFAGSSIIQQAG